MHMWLKKISTYLNGDGLPVNTQQCANCIAKYTILYFFPGPISQRVSYLLSWVFRVFHLTEKAKVPRKAFSTFMFFPRKVIVLFVHSRLFCSIIFRCTASYISGRDMHNLWKGYHHLFFALSLTVSAPSLWICVCSDHLNVFLTIWPDFCTWDLFLILVYDTFLSLFFRTNDDVVADTCPFDHLSLDHCGRKTEGSFLP